MVGGGWYDLVRFGGVVVVRVRFGGVVVKMMRGGPREGQTGSVWWW